MDGNEKPILRRTLIIGAAAGLGAACTKKPTRGQRSEEISPSEDLMREHGVLNRLLLIYEECKARIDTSIEELPLQSVNGAAGIIRTFIEGYHEKLEEAFLFPRFERAQELVPLVGTLRRQHDSGRVLTERIQQIANPVGVRGDGKRNLVAAIDAFVRMYRPHEAREDTVLFPAFRELVSARELDDLGEQFEETEHKLFGKDGFKEIVQQVSNLEQKLDIHDLNVFTPVSLSTSPPHESKP